MRAFAATTKNLVESARVHHNTSPVATAALGRTLTAGAIMGSMMKNDTDMLTLQIRGDGPIEGITVTADSHANVKGYVNLLAPKEGLKYCFSVGENDEYEEYVEQVITAPVDSEQLKVIHTNYPTTILTSENKISVEYVADTEAYIEKRIKEENQSLQKQILEIQNALISQKI